MGNNVDWAKSLRKGGCVATDDKDDIETPFNEKEAIRKQRKQFILFALAGLFMLIIAFFAGRTVKEWVSDDESAPVGVSIVQEVSYVA